MSRRVILPSVLLTCLVLAAAHTALAAQAPSTKPAIDPRAQQTLRQMSDYVSGLQRFTVHANTTMELITSSDMLLDADREVDLSVERPNHIRIDSHVPEHNRQMFYDGQTVTIYSPDKNYYTVIPAKPTIQETIEAARRNGIELPLGDLLYQDPYSAIMGRAKHAYYIGISLVGGVKCKHLAFRGKDMDWQIWIEDSNTPLPRRVVIADRAVYGQPRYSATLTDWNTSPTFTADTFTFTPPAGAQKVGFVPKGLGTLKGRFK